MRVLVTTPGSAGHFGPLIPFADALRDAGDDVLVATRDVDRRTASARRASPSGRYDEPPRERARADLRAVRATSTTTRRTGSSSPRCSSASTAPRRSTTCARSSRTGSPTSCCTRAPSSPAPLAAERTGVPVAVVGIGLGAVERKFIPVAIAALAPLRARLGLPAEPETQPALLHARAAAARRAAAPRTRAASASGGPGRAAARLVGRRRRAARVPHVRHGRAADGLLPRALPRGDRRARRAAGARARHHRAGPRSRRPRPAAAQRPRGALGPAGRR